MDEKLFQVILTLIPVIGAIITYYLVPILKSKVDDATLAKCIKWSKLAVQAAEMIIKGSGRGVEKKEIVVTFLNEFLNKNKIIITEQQLNIIIEAAVQELNKGKKEEQ